MSSGKFLFQNGQSSIYHWGSEGVGGDRLNYWPDTQGGREGRRPLGCLRGAVPLESSEKGWAGPASPNQLERGLSESLSRSWIMVPGFTALVKLCTRGADFFWRGVLLNSVSVWSYFQALHYIYIRLLYSVTVLFYICRDRGCRRAADAELFCSGWGWGPGVAPVSTPVCSTLNLPQSGARWGGAKPQAQIAQ